MQYLSILLIFKVKLMKVLILCLDTFIITTSTLICKVIEELNFFGILDPVLPLYAESFIYLYMSVRIGADRPPPTSQSIKAVINYFQSSLDHNHKQRHNPNETSMEQHYSFYRRLNNSLHNNHRHICRLSMSNI